MTTLSPSLTPAVERVLAERYGLDPGRARAVLLCWEAMLARGTRCVCGTPEHTPEAVAFEWDVQVQVGWLREDIFAEHQGRMATDAAWRTAVLREARARFAADD